MDPIFTEKLINSYEKLLERELIDDPSKLFEADFVCAGHKFASEPKFAYGNQKALDLWELDLDKFIGMPSKNTAEEMHQKEREELLNEVRQKGYIKNYSGIRISSTGKKFKINNAIVWNVFDENEKLIGQAVKFNDYEYLT